MPTFLDDLDAVDPNTVEQIGPAYPVAQWTNGDPKMAAVGGVAHTGGLLITEKYIGDEVIPPAGWTRTNFSFGSGKTEKVMACQKPNLAVIRTRFRWFVTANGVTTYYPRAGYVADAGMRGHVQALCGVRGFDFPVVVTFKGMASKEFETLLREFSQKTQDAAGKLLRAKGGTAQKFPRFAFWLRIAPDVHKKVGQKGQESVITPPLAEMPEVLTEEYLSKIYVGRESLLAFQQIYHEAAEWAAQWDKAGAEESDAPAHVDPDTGEITDTPAPRNNPANLDEDGFFGDEYPKTATLNIGDGRKWLQLTKALAKQHPHYSDGKGAAQMERIINAAGMAGFKEINNSNMEAVIEALAERVAVARPNGVTQPF